MSRSVFFISVFIVILDLLHAGQTTATGAGSEPQVAVLCEAGSTYHPQFLAQGGRWQADLTTKPQACLKDKMEILDYCKKMYPTHDITNIVEASHYVKISNWCKVGSNNAAKCKVSRWVKPFRCLEGPFQSDALLVPESCLFDHIHNQSRCWQFARWNATAGRACSQRGLRLRTFAMLLPCGISLFSGVEFVCCPKHFKENVKMHKPMEIGGVPLNPGSEDMMAAAAAMDERDDSDDLIDDDVLDDDDDDDDDDDLNLSDDDDDDDSGDDNIDEDEDMDINRDTDADSDDDYTDDESGWPRSETSTLTAASSTAPSTTSTTSTTTTQSSPATSDPYFSHFDPRTEHQSYKDAQQRLEETHREKITKVMKDWGELEERYQEMETADPAGAQAFRQHMTAKFTANIQALEEAGVAERRRLAALHQQRVLAHLAQRRRAASACYTRALQDTPPNTHRVQKCLQRLVRALAAERAGALAAWRRAAAAGKEAAAAERAHVTDRLQDADRALQRALGALRKKPHLYAKIGTAIEDYVQSMQSKDDVAVSLLSMTAEAENLLLDRIVSEVRHDAQRARQDLRAKQRQDIQDVRTRTSSGLKETEELDDEASEESSSALPAPASLATSVVPSQAASASPASVPSSSHSETLAPESTTQLFTQETTANEWTSSTGEASSAAAAGSGSAAVTVDSGALQAALEQAEVEHAPPPAHAMRHDISHAQPGYSFRTAPEAHAERSAGALYPALCVGAAALAGAAAVAMAVARRRTRAPPAQGFVQVEQTAGAAPTPEERHVANMQINGYENPTYKYFEVKE